MFGDASAIVAILTREPDADTRADALDGARSPITTPLLSKGKDFRKTDIDPAT